MRRFAETMRKLLKDPSKDFTGGGYTGAGTITHQQMMEAWDKRLRPGEATHLLSLLEQGHSEGATEPSTKNTARH